MKSFFKFFLIAFLIFVVVLIPVNISLDKMGATVENVRIFSGTENLMKEMDSLVDPSSPFFDAFQNTNRVNVLLLGVNDGLSDTLMLVSYDLDQQHVDVISIPRDTYYAREGVKGAAYKKINSIYQSDKAVGTATAVSDVLEGIPINYYVTVEYADVVKIVDAMGGVPMNIPFNMKYTDIYDKPPLRINLKKGQQTLNGDQAMQFLRYRHGYPEGDIGRIKAHQEFVKSAFNQALSLSLPKVIGTAFENIDSDLTLGTALKLAKSATKLDSGSIETYLLPGESGTREKLSFWNPDEEGIQDMLKTIYSLDTKTEENTSGGAVTE